MSNIITAMRQISKNRDLILNMLIFVIFCIYSVLLTIYHEPWRDEAQTWLLVRDLNLLELLAQLRHEHPFLWYLILFPFVKLGFPYAMQQVIHVLFVCGCAYLICFKSPFNSFCKFFVLISSYLFYTVNAFARNYTPSIFFLLLIATVFDKRHSKYWYVYAISLFCLINMSVQGAVAAIAIFCSDMFSMICFWIKRKISPGQNRMYTMLSKYSVYTSIIFVFGIVCFVVILRTSLFNHFLLKNHAPGFYHSDIFYNPNFSFNSFVHQMTSFAQNTSFDVFTFIFAALGGYSDTYSTVIFALIVALLIFAIYLFVFPAIISRRKELRLFIVCCGASITIGMILILMMANYGYSPRYASVPLFTAIVLYWLALEKTTIDAEKNIIIRNNRMEIVKKSVAFIMIFILTLCMYNRARSEFESAISDFKYDCSGSKRTATFLKNEGYDAEDVLIAATMHPMTSAIIPYFENVRVFLYDYGFKSFVYWQELPHPLVWNTDVYPNLENELNNNPEKYKKAIIIISSSETELKKIYDSKFEKIYETEGISMIADEVYTVYRVK